jgi:hypothetical protein
VKQRHLSGKIVMVGWDAAPDEIAALKSGEISALIVQNPFRMGFDSVVAMTEHIRRNDAIEYDPHLHNGKADPGEVVWGWVPFEEDPSQGKDRPVVVIGERGGELLTLMLTSKDHHRDAEHQAHEHRYWMDVGTGTWDREGRPSEVRLNRLIVLDPHAVRREGSVLPQEIFEKVLVAAEAYLD